MLKFRNISLLRRIYVWGLSIITRLAYSPDQRVVPPDFDVHPSAQRIARINSELENGPEEWQKEFLASSGYLSSPRLHDAFQLGDITFFLNDGIEAITNDTLSRCFTEQPPHPWNFLTRNIPSGPWQMTLYQSVLWAIGIWARYCIFLPFRIVVLLAGVMSFAVGWQCASLFPGIKRQAAVRQWMLRYLASVFVSSWSGYIKFHGKRPKKQPNQIYVSNHTSLIDFFILNKDYTFSCIGQRHGGLAGFLQDLVLKAQDHVWFDREEGNDRRAVQRLLRTHVADGDKEPMLVFPEGTCVHSQYCVMFKKGSFELGATVHPIAMKYRHRFADPFWNSRRCTFPRHLFDLMTSWAVVCDVYYMEPQDKLEDEIAVEFANRVKRLISNKIGLVDLNWDGYLKRHKISPKFLEARQRAIGSIITRRLNGELPRAASTSVLVDPNGDIQQTLAHITPQAAELDSLDFERFAAQQNTLNYRQLLGIRRRHGAASRGRSNQRGRNAQMNSEGGRFTNSVTRFAAYAVHHTVRWVVAMGMLVGAALVTNRFMPTSWKQSIRLLFR